MARAYKPRRAAKRWTNNAPAWVLDCFYHPDFADCYTVICGADDMFLDSRGYPYLVGISTSENGGTSGSFEMAAHEAANYRYRSKHRRIAWESLPEVTRNFVTSWHDSE